MQSVGTLWKTRESFDRAIHFLQRAATKIADDEVLYFDLGFCLQKNNKVDEAIASYRKALEISPNDAATLNNLGIALKAKGLLDETIAAILTGFTTGDECGERSLDGCAASILARKLLLRAPPVFGCRDQF